MAITRRAGQPYTISEFNQPWPNRHAAEIDPTLAAFAALQDWDAIVHFAYSHGHNWDNGAAESFNINGDWTKYPNIGQSAWLFRTGAVQAARTSLVVAVTRAMQLEAGRGGRGAGNVAGFLARSGGFDPAVALVHRVAIAKDTGTRIVPAGPPPYRSDTGELVYDPAQKLFTMAAPQAAGVIGFPGRNKVTAGAVEVQLGPASGDFASILVTALDGKPLTQSARLLISTPGYTLGTVPGSDPPRMQKFVHYPGTEDWWTLEPGPGETGPSDRMGGSPPLWMERVESTITLHSTAKTVVVYPLDGRGERMEALAPAAVTRCAGGFVIHLQADGQQFTPWYEVSQER